MSSPLPSQPQETPSLPTDRPELPRVVAASAGAAWWGKGWRILKSNFWTWIGIMLVYLIAAVLINVVPYVGSLGYALLAPVLLGGLMLGCRAIDRSEPLRVAHLFEGFQSTHFVALMTVGAVNVAFSLVIMALTKSSYMDELKISDLSKLATMDIPVDAFGGTSMWKSLLALVVGTLCAMLTWFAPALIALRGTAAVEAMKLSFRTCLRNWVPLLVYGIIAIGVMLVAVFAILFASAWFVPGPVNDILTLLAFAAVFIVILMVAGAVIALFVGPIVVGSIYAGYEDMFGVNDGDPLRLR